MSPRLRGEKQLDLSRAHPLPRSFYNRDPRQVGPDLLGKILLRRIRSRGKEIVLAGRIVEDEAYLGLDDAAAHAAAGKTSRNAVLFGPPGHAYVYFIYGNHYCLNVSCLPEGNAGCVLIRALEPMAGEEHMARARALDLKSGAKNLRLLTSGPGRLCEALSITRPRDNGKDLTAHGSDLFIASDGYLSNGIRSTPRIGITKAAEQPLRYVLAGNPFVSGRRVPST